VDGLPLISFFNSISPNGYVTIVHCSDALCNNATRTQAPYIAPTRVGLNNPIAIGADGLGFVTYLGQVPGSSYGIVVLRCSNVVCSSVTAATALIGPYLAFYSIAIGPDGLGLISYTDDYEGGPLKVAHCSNVTCSSATSTTIDTDIIKYTSISIGSDGLGLIGYFDTTTNTFKIAHCSNVACTSAIVTPIENAFLGATSVAMGSDGLPLISYSGNSQGGIKVMHCASPLCVGYQHR